MTKVINKGVHTQNIFLSSVGGPAVVAELLAFVPDSSIDVGNVAIGQTEPPLVRKIDAQTVTDLGLDAVNWTFHLRCVRRVDSSVRIDTTISGSVVYSLQADGSAHLTYAITGTDFDVAGSHDFQLRAIKAADLRVLYWEAEKLTVRAA